MRVLLTHEEGGRVDADGRAAIANNNKADLFISLHANGSPRPTVRGAVIYTLSLDRVGEDARRQSQADRAVLPVFGGGAREVALVEWELAQAAHLDGSNAFAGIVDQKLRDDRGAAVGGAPARADAQSCRRQHARRAHRDGLSLERRRREAARLGRIPERHRARADRGGRRVPRSRRAGAAGRSSAMKKQMPRGFGLYVALAALLVAGLIALLVLGPRWLTTVPDEAARRRQRPRPTRERFARACFTSTSRAPDCRASSRKCCTARGTAEQARRIVEAQIAPAPAPHVSAIPAGTKLRTVFFTKAGEIYVDLSADLQTNHPGGTTNETLTVYALVSALTSNLPAVTGVQILVEGKEVDTLAGHLDLRRPIEQDLKWVTN